MRMTMKTSYGIYEGVVLRVSKYTTDDNCNYGRESEGRTDCNNYGLSVRQ